MRPFDDLVAIKCPRCGDITMVSMTTAQYSEWQLPKRHRRDVGAIFPDKKAVERETLITGLCQECQTQIFKACEEPEEDES
jgi:ABC-type ATPase involved in cell division